MEPAQEPVKRDLIKSDIGTVWEYKGERYRIEGFINLKDPQDARWYQGVLYSPLDNSPANGYPYARYESDFLAKFRRV